MRHDSIAYTLAVIKKNEKIMKKTIIAFLMLVVNVTAYSQNSCDCSKTLEQLMFKVENEYPGFELKTKDTIAYKSFKNNLVELSKISNKNDCFNILKKYTDYFRDGHLVIQNNIINNKSTETKKTETVSIDINNFNKYLENSKDNIEGIWTSDGYKVGIIKKDSFYSAFIISSQNESWKQSEIKFRLKQNGNAIYYMGNHAQENVTYSVIKNSIIYFKSLEVAFIKQFPLPELIKENLTKKLNELEGFYIKPISEKTLLLRISSFDYSYTKRIEELIEINKTLLEKYDNLIIDVRGNGGGTDYGYRPILPYLYTNPVRHLSGEYLVTQTLIDGLSNWLKTADTKKYADEIVEVNKDLERMNGKIGQFIPYDAEDNYGYKEQDTVYAYPRNVVILANSRSASSTEKFILDAKQSKKVKVFGTPTYGAVDYVSVRKFKLDCERYSLYMPTIRMMRLPDYPIDNIGIQPDVYMDKYVKDWVQYAKEYMENE